jgi:hypothetical protein
MYQPSTVDVIYLTLPQASIDALEADHDTYQPGEFSISTTDGTPDGIETASAPRKVSVRLKGQLGSSRSLNQKAAFKLKFKGSESYLGLKKMTLNNMVQDPSMIHETLAYSLFRDTDVPAPRTGYAYVYVNGVDYGLHLNLETLDDVALEKRFGPFQHLYEGAYGSDVGTGPEATPAEVATAAEKFEIDEGADEAEVEGEKFRADLEALIVAVNGTVPADFSQRLDPLADLKEMTRMWAIEKYVGHWDGYSGQAGFYWPNNFYLFSDTAGAFQMLPWGTDQSWGSRLSFDGTAGLLFNRCLEDDSCAAMYRDSLQEAQAVIGAANLDALASATADLLEPWEELEQGNGGHHEFGLDAIHGAVEATRAFIAARPGDLAAWLSTQPVPARLTVALEPATIPADGASMATATAVVTDADGQRLPGEHLVFSSSDGAQRFGAVSEDEDGVYSVRITASTAAGAATITATDTAVDPGVGGSALLTQTPLARVPAPATSGSSARPASGAPQLLATRLTAKPPRRTRDRRPTFRFVSDPAGVAFQCRLGSRSYQSCSSPQTLPRLAPGFHVFSVRSVGATGQPGPPAVHPFTVKPTPASPTARFATNPPRLRRASGTP